MVSWRPAASALAVLSSPASSGSFGDNYWGGIDTLSGSNKDIIGSSSVFNISYVDVSRTNGGNTLKIVIHTNYAGEPGTSSAQETTYGSLFTSVANYSPIGTVQNVANYKISNVAQYYQTLDGKIIMSNMKGDPITAPYSGNPGYYFRPGQAVQLK